ncbi:GHKL domain-containing protein [Sporomusa malonica]|uniref:Sensor_kinase_SpoOB-type, alpha-helical domain n=1 Tax=Sporomusa malonica TaxID=112901 RepID=A0A1W2CWU3_9FIRM|nr:GHKL domain-containing protein [Sporomusa malonica]SMC89719.1 Sensor_kinase_SpoOB-type, alpha-helical domain [Sporomusa malonica]
MKNLLTLPYLKNKKVKTIILVATLILLLLTSMNLLVTYNSTINSVKVAIANQGIEMAKSIAEDLDTETYKRVLTGKKVNEDYWKISSYLYEAKKKTSAMYVYTLLVDNPQVSKVMVYGTTPNSPIQFPIEGFCTLPEDQIKLALQGGTYYTDILHDPEMGDYLSVGAPIKDHNGQIMGYLGIDMSAELVKQISREVVTNSYSTFLFNVIFTFILLVTFFIIQKWYQLEMKKAIGDTEQTYQEEFLSFLTSVKSLRHDFVNHIQVLYGLIEFRYYDKALEYMKSLFTEVKLVDLSLKVNNPALLVLFQSKFVVAQNKQIEMQFELAQDLFDQVKSTDLIKIFSNLLDNAIEATIQLPVEERYIKITGKNFRTSYYFEVENSGPTISETARSLLFNQGYTTKQPSGDKTRGLGLYIVKGIIKQVHGEISFTSQNQINKISIIIPIITGG